MRASTWSENGCLDPDRGPRTAYRYHPIPSIMAKSVRNLEGRILVTGPSGVGKSTLCRYFREHGVNAVDGDDTRLGGAVDLQGRPLRHITKDQWRRIEDWRFYWEEGRLKRFLKKNPNVVLFGASDNLFDLDLIHLFDRRIYLDASWSLVWARLNHPARDNNWGLEPAQRSWVRRAVRDWPMKARRADFEFIIALCVERLWLPGVHGSGGKGSSE